MVLREENHLISQLILCHRWVVDWPVGASSAEEGGGENSISHFGFSWRLSCRGFYVVWNYRIAVKKREK